MSGQTAEITRAYDDNGTVQAVYGPYNAHLDAIERRLNVTLLARGNAVTIRGPAGPVRTAGSALDRLYAMASGGRPIESGDVEAAVRLSAAAADAGDQDLPELKTRRRRVMPRSPTQAAYLRAIETAPLVFGLGPAGTGKTYLAVAAAVSMMLRGDVERLVLSRPAVEAGERLGFLPGDMKDKVDPYLRPLYDALHDMLPVDEVARKMETGRIEVAPLAFMRGRTLRSAFVILDEAQNTSPMQMKMALTRLGEGSRMVVTGDPSQVDLPPGAASGLRDALSILTGVEGVSVVRFTESDVVRHDLVARIIAAYDARDRSTAAKRGGGNA